MADATKEVLQLIGPEGKARAGAESTLPSLSKDLLIRLWKNMVLTRALDTRCMNLQRQGRIHFYAPSSGQEASTTGSSLALEETDWCFPSYREVGVLVGRGMPLDAIANQVYGNAKDWTKGRQMPVHWASRKYRVLSISSPIATQIPQAVGCAYAMKLRKDPSIAIAYFGDGATSEGDFHVGLNFAGVWKVPCVFFCQNNQWAISVPLAKQTASETIAIKARAYGFEGVRVDGNDVLAVYQAVRAAREKAVKGGGPTLIEALTYRMGPHSTSDDPRRYRPESETQKWQGKDPIVRFRQYLLERGVLKAEEAERLEEEARAAVTKATDEAETVGPPDPGTLLDDVYSKKPPHLEEQRGRLLAEAESAGEAPGEGEERAEGEGEAEGEEK